MTLLIVFACRSSQRVAASTMVCVRDGGTQRHCIILVFMHQPCQSHYGVALDNAVAARSVARWRCCTTPAPRSPSPTGWSMPTPASRVEARAVRRAALRGGGVPGGSPGTVGGALAMNAGCYGGETWTHVARVESCRATGVRRAHAGRVRDRLSQRRAARRPRARRHLHRGVVPLPAGRRRTPRADQGAAREAHRDAAAGAAERRQRVPQSAGRPCGAADRGLRAQGHAIGGAQRVGEARELHRQSGAPGDAPRTSRR